MTVTIAPANALPHAREIKELFLAHERPEFPDFFDRAYPPAFANGATSWLGRDPDGRLVMHIACVPRRFRFAGREAVAGLLINLMVTTRYRSFFPALALIQRLVQDSKALGAVDFLYTDPNEESRTLLRGTRFAQVGVLRRYVLPVGDQRPLMDLAVRAVHRLLRVAHRAPRDASTVAHRAAEFHVDAFGTPPAQSPRLTPYHDRALYRSRLKGYPADRDWWFTWGPSGTSHPTVAVLIRGPDPRGLAIVHAVRRTHPSHHPVAAFLPGLVAELRHRGCARLQITTLAESALGRELRRVGFLPRTEAVPLVALALTPLGEECIRSVNGWEITDLDCDR